MPEILSSTSSPFSYAFWFSAWQSVLHPRCSHLKILLHAIILYLIPVDHYLLRNLPR